ncbi:triphosphoribosyl-dephospho-CoA synthase [Methylophaga sp. OBS1]|jgi:triphosphoribosyl-dephospho-CoA synthase|uniref:triphosphoribosyl-dephospho-CoA synthase n=1 Tax=Methylophaga sp. OBS1 TaxID=2991933 RepID=UPI0022523F53|nr:triphosphoribosyl-dephospho-CoA synthase [Methylophaga sp. OBS1]MCX4192649.1 triphosphoribosyl-dephospho-CoA synthase [Methylophaga sp. OBS1]
MLSESEIADSVFWACEKEVRAPKPGNVNCFSDGHNMAVDDFIRSARAIAPVMAQPGLTVGARILAAITATRQVVDCNTNLGIVLLFAPLCCAVEQSETFDDLTDKLRTTLQNLTVEDARLTYQAIRMAEAGGLGRHQEQDISGDPSVTLLQAMKMAAERDQIALQYVSNFSTLWEIGLPGLTSALNSGESVEWAAAFAYLKLLSELPDSLICRKQSREQAIAVTKKAKQLVFEMNKNSTLNAYSNQLTAWDKELKQNAINPGTTADLVAATLLLHAFQRRLSANRISVP